MNEAEKLIKNQDERTQDFARMVRAGGVTIDDLPPATAAEPGDLIEIQKAQESMKVSMQQLADLIGAGGGGTTDYHALTNKPSIDNVELDGNKTSVDLGLAKADEVVKLTGDQTIAGTKTFTGTISTKRQTFSSKDLTSGDFLIRLQADEMPVNSYYDLIRVHRKGVAWYIRVNSDANGNISVSIPNMVSTSGDQVINGTKEFRDEVRMATAVRLGRGSTIIKITPEDNTTKTIQWGDTAVNPGKILHHNMLGACRIYNLPAPQSDTDAARKAEIDSLSGRIDALEQSGLIGRAELKDIANQSTDFNDFKRRIGQL